MQYFTDCKTQQELKAKYKDLAKKHHPDKGGNLATFQEIQNQYDNHTFIDAEEQRQHDKYGANFHEIIEALAGLNIHTIDIIGHWLWVTFDKADKEAFKEAVKPLENWSYIWNRKRKLWQIKPTGMKHFKRDKEERSKDDLQNFYGGHSVKVNKQKQVQPA